MPQDTNIRRLLWLYFFLVIFEGALRKWILPQLSMPLLVARDPICLLTIYLGFPYLVRQPWVLGFIGIGVISIPLALAFGHGNITVALFGARIWLLHIPVLFLFGAVFNRDDVWKFAKVLLAIAIPMTILLAIQFRMPPSHIVNVGVGGDGTSVFSGAAGRYRSSGTFSFINGLSIFYGLAGALFVGWLVSGPRPLPKWFFVSGACFMLAVPLAISRTIAFYYGLIGMLALFAAGSSPQHLKRVILAALAVVVIGVGVSQTTLFETASDAFSVRWESASRNEGGDAGALGSLKKRVIDRGVLAPFKHFDEYPLFGRGIGIGTQAGAKLATGERGFLITEGAWGSVLGELGPVFGLLLIGYRVAFAGFLGLSALVCNRRGNALPLIIGSVAIHGIFMGNTGQPTELGFIVLSCGLMMAAFKDRDQDSLRL